MILRYLRLAGFPALVALSALAGCSKDPAPQVAFINADVSGGDQPELCGNDGIILRVGDMQSAVSPTTVPDGSNGATVDCSVQAGGDGFDIQLDVAQPGPAGDQEVVIFGHVNSSGGTVSAQFVSAAIGQFRSMDCAITYTYLGQPIKHPVGPGTIWGHIKCTDAMDKGRQVDLPDGGAAQETCEANADFLFDNCTGK